MSPLDALLQQEDTLVLPAFDETTAYAIGTALRAAALEREAPVVIDIRSGTRQLYFSALPGSHPDNADWARRKANLTLHCHASSLRVKLQLEAEQRSAWPDAALNTADYAAHGGAFPVRVRGVGVVAAIGVSGLPSRDDHAIIVAALAAHLGFSNIVETP
ncbi:heme-degrading domain-containing protein [Rhodoferax sp.]|uniref:heme-degrading domain-containing protein n=1 Tax=Rhodoferax sp. TaxID=50421 RepID=UPI0025D39218|nr:heme-degrading domain-containing protein [Rhodoferax sp.]